MVVTDPASDPPTQLVNPGVHLGPLPPAEVPSPSNGAGSFMIAILHLSPCNVMYGAEFRFRHACVSVAGNVAGTVVNEENWETLESRQRRIELRSRGMKPGSEAVPPIASIEDAIGKRRSIGSLKHR